MRFGVKTAPMHSSWPDIQGDGVGRVGSLACWRTPSAIGPPRRSVVSAPGVHRQRTGPGENTTPITLVR